MVFEIGSLTSIMKNCRYVKKITLIKKILKITAKIGKNLGLMFLRSLVTYRQHNISIDILLKDIK